VIRHFTASGIVLSDEHVLLVEHRKPGWWLYPAATSNLTKSRPKP
jgi:hypothetical protein